MLTAIEIVFWAAAALIVWTQLGYGLALWLAWQAKSRRQRARDPQHGASRHEASLSRARTRTRALGRPIHTTDPLSPPPQPERRATHPRSPERGGASPPSALQTETPTAPRDLPSVSLIVAAHNEQAVIAAKVANALSLRYPRELLEVVVACDGCTDATAEIARGAGADSVLELPRGGKIRAQDAAVARSEAEIVAFSDANSLWQPDALATLLAAFADPAVAYACGRLAVVQAVAGVDATNQEGAYWRYEMALRTLESDLCSVTAGNGAIYALRRERYIVVDPVMGHDLSLPFNMVKRGHRAIYVPAALALEKMVPTIEAEQARKRRMMAHTWAIIFKTAILSPAGYPPVYWLMILTHRLLRYLTPFLHLVALAANALALALGAGPVYLATLCLQAAILLAAALGSRLRLRPLLLARYYVLATSSLAQGLIDWLIHGVSASWQPPREAR